MKVNDKSPLQLFADFDQPNLHPLVVSAAFGGLVAGDRRAIAITVRDHPPCFDSFADDIDGHQGGTFGADQITNLAADSTGIDAEADFGTNELTWDYDALNGPYDFQIYRSVDGKPMRAYATTNGRGGINFAAEVASGGLVQVAAGGFAWKDPEVGNARVLAQSGFPAAVPGSPLKRTFRYQVQARHFDGGWSPVSEVVEIEVLVPGN